MPGSIGKLALLSILLAWGTVAGQNLLNNPETIVYDSIYDRYLVSNMSSYNIVEIDQIGNYSVFSSAVYRPYGMVIVGNTLYVGGDRGNQGGIFGFDLATGEEVFSVLTSGWYWSINGLTADTSGNVYFAVTGQSRIYKLDPTARSYTVFVSGTIPIPNAVYCDTRNNRLLVTTNVWWEPVYAVDLDDASVLAVTTLTGQFSGLAEDALHNIYIAFFAQGNVYRLDSTLVGDGEIISSGHNGPEGICFDKIHSILCVPNLMGNTISFVPLNIDVWMAADTTRGWAPLEVNFDGASVFEINDWLWDFGDGDFASGQSPTHIYNTPGLYDVKVQAITNTGDTLERVYAKTIYNLADTLWAPGVDISSDEPYSKVDLEVQIHARNNVPLKEMLIPVGYSGELALVYDSFSVEGCRTESFGSIQQPHSNSTDKTMTFKLRPRIGSPLYMDAGSGPVMKLYFHTFGAPGQEVSISLSGYSPSYMPSFAAAEFQYSPVAIGGVVNMSYQCGDASGDGEINIGDAVVIIYYVFKGGPPPSPVEAGDANCDGNCNVGDAVYLINYVFRGGAEPCADCP
jgi:PKD repeat protein